MMCILISSTTQLPTVSGRLQSDLTMRVRAPARSKQLGAVLNDHAAQFDDGRRRRLSSISRAIEAKSPELQETRRPAGDDEGSHARAAGFI